MILKNETYYKLVGGKLVKATKKEIEAHNLKMSTKCSRHEYNPGGYCIRCGYGQDFS